MNVFILGIYFFIAMVFVVSSVSLCRKIVKKIKINRWIIGFGAPLILIVPKIAFKNINPILWTFLILLFVVLYILFFEVNRKIYETKGIKETINFRRKM